MTQRVLGPTGSPRRRWTLLVALTAVLAFGLFYVAGAQAVHEDGNFELDTPSANAQDGIGTTGDDWDNVCASNPTTCTFKNTYTPPGPSSADASSHENDGNLDATIFHGGGSKDPQPIANWLWKDGAGGLPDKDNLLHAYAARYDDVIYFGSDRYANDGDATQAFWFLQNEIAANGAASQGGFRFTGGGHRDGDLLIISEFSNGGTTSTITVYRWAGSDATGSLQLLSGGDDKSCDTVGAGDPYCGIVNTATDPTLAPWVFTDKAGSNDFRQGELYEAGIDLGALSLGGSCFSTFVAETRSSTSTTATLKDFVLGGFEQCGSTLVTTPKLSDGTTNVPTAGAQLGSATSGAGTVDGQVQVKDSANLTVTGVGTWSGTMKFFLCGPIANTATCTSGGLQIGSDISVNQSTAKPIVSAAAILTKAANNTTGAPGRYCFRGEFVSATLGVPDATDSSSNECFYVKPVTPSLDTDAGDGPVNLGQAVTDTAALTGTAKQPASDGSDSTYPSIFNVGQTPTQAAAGGTITFQLYGPFTSGTPTSTECAALGLAAGFATAYPNGIQRTVSGDGTYPTGGQSAVSYTPQDPGWYFWKASYGGNDPNTLASGEHNTNCSDTDEAVLVNKIPTQIRSAQGWFPNDSARIKSSVSGDSIQAGGTVDFYLYDNATCSGTLRYSERVTIGAGDISGGIATVFTRNYPGGAGVLPPGVGGAWAPWMITTLLSDAANSTVNYSWKVVYSGDTAHLGRQSNCNVSSPTSIEKFTITYTNDNSGGTALP